LKKVNKKDTFIQKSKSIHGDRYDYSLVEYQNNKTKVKIICEKHGEFYQLPLHHTKGSGCQKCNNSYKYTTKEVIEQYKEIHGSKYDYSLVEYKSKSSLVEIICKEHGIFKQRSDVHKRGFGCPLCSNKKQKSNDGFINESITKFGDKFTYEKCNYISLNEKVIITCKKHGDFECNPNNHLSKLSGCPKCCSSKGETIIRNLLEVNNIYFEEQFQFVDCVYKKELKFDFYLPEYNTCIEYDGKQHFEPIKHFGGVSEYNKTKKRDIIKNKYCDLNNINLIRIPYYDINNIEKYLIFT
jgi:hypothetical protein